MTIFADLREVALDLIQKYGTALQLRKVTEGAYSVATGTASENESITYSFNGAISTSPPETGLGISPVFSLNAGDLLVTVPDNALSVAIEARDIVILDSEEWRVLAVDPPYDDDTVVVRTVQLRRGDF